MSLFSRLTSKRASLDDARQPLLPQYHHDTVREQRLHEKLHTYQMLRALIAGYMPSTEQLIINLRTLLASDLLNPDQSSLTDSGFLLLKHIKALINACIDTLQHKAPADEVQDLLWYLTKARVDVDTQDLATRASATKSKANTAAAYQSARTVGTLLLQSSDFRLLLSDIRTIGLEVFQDSASTVSKVAEDFGRRAQPAVTQHTMAVQVADSKDPPSKEQLAADMQSGASIVKEGAANVGEQTWRSAVDHLSSDEKHTILKRLQSAIARLTQKPDYVDSVSTLSILLQRYVSAYSMMLTDTLETVAEDVQENEQANKAVRALDSLLKKFGEPSEWDALQQNFERLVGHQRSSRDFGQLINSIAALVKRSLIDPSLFEDNNAEIEWIRLLEESKDSRYGPSFSEDFEKFVLQGRRTILSIFNDEDVSRMLNIVHKLLHTLSPAKAIINNDLIHDMLNVFTPLLINAVQHIPIPRLELLTPDLDLLLENLILEPGRTVNNTSFLPFRLRIESFNKVELRKTISSTISSTASLFTIKVDGLSLRADDIGYWLRMHKGIFRFVDTGFASFQLDERGIDIHVDVEVGKDRLESILSLKQVRVRIHHLTYTLSRSKFSWLATLLKPLITPFIRKTIEHQLGSAIAEFIHGANREVVFARERLRATRIADPGDLATFVRAVASRLQSAGRPDVYARVGVRKPGKGLFKGMYAPGSMAKVWEEEASRVKIRIENCEQGGWRNDIFNVRINAPNNSVVD